MQLSIINAVAGVTSKGLSIIDQFVEDKDLRNELAVKQLELMYGLLEKIINTSTVPQVDALVKLILALIALARPLGALYLTIMGVDMASASIQAGGEVNMVEGTLIGAFPTWGVAREADKRQKEVTRQKAIDTGWPIEEFD